MSTDNHLAWHADDDLLSAYVAGRTRPPATASVEMHLLHCPACRDAVTALVDPVPLGLVWDRVADDLQVPQRTRTERIAARLGLSDRDALLVAAAPALRGSWLLGLLLCLLFAVIGVAQGAPNGSLLFLALTPLVPVAAVAFAYGQDVDPMWDTTLAAPYSPLRLLLLRSVSVVVVALPLALAAGPLLRGPSWVAVAWLVPGLACAALTLALSTWVSVSRAAVAVSGCWIAAVIVAAGPAVEDVLLVVAAPLLAAYLVVAVLASAVFWMRSDRLSYLGRNP